MTHSRIKLTKYGFQSHQTHKMVYVGGSMIALLPQMDLVPVDVRGGQIHPDVQTWLVRVWHVNSSKSAGSLSLKILSRSGLGDCFVYFLNVYTCIEVYIYLETLKKSRRRALLLFLWLCSVVDFFVSTDGSCSRFLGAEEVRISVSFPVRCSRQRSLCSVNCWKCVSIDRLCLWTSCLWSLRERDRQKLVVFVVPLHSGTLKTWKWGNQFLRPDSKQTRSEWLAAAIDFEQVLLLVLILAVIEKQHD